MRSEVTINLSRPLEKLQASECLPLLYYIVGFFSDAPSPCGFNITLRYIMKVKEQLVVRRYMDVNGHERRFNITLRYKLK